MQDDNTFSYVVLHGIHFRFIGRMDHLRDLGVSHERMRRCIPEVENESTENYDSDIVLMLR